MKKVILITALMLVSGCATTPAMRVSRARALTDMSVTGLIDYKIVTPTQVLQIVAELKNALDNLETVPEYTAAVFAQLRPYIGGKVLAKLLLKTLPDYAFKLEEYRYGLGQALNQAEVAAKEYPNAK